ncbi:MAG: 4-hydroxyproline epimerase [Limisphaerales bacterium]|jgi:4-hydroxyproline epimerase
MRVIDSHTEGEPTRIVLEGGPDLGVGALADRRDRFAREFDSFRSAVINEPRGSDVLVGALLCEPVDPTCAAGAIFFNNVGYLGMCGHATIGLAVTLGYLGRITPGRHRIETPVGVVTVELTGANTVTIENVPSYRLLENVAVKVEGLGEFVGDVAWGGNWFFLVDGSPFPLDAAHTTKLKGAAECVKSALRRNGITGADGAEIDHVEFLGEPESADANGRNFVLCPGGAYDRSPCGTGTSAKLACLAAAGKLQPGETWIQESVIGSRFEGSYRLDEAGQVIPSITGRAFICGETNLIQQPGDPFANGIAAVARDD